VRLETLRRFEGTDKEDLTSLSDLRSEKIFLSLAECYFYAAAQGAITQQNENSTSGRRLFHAFTVVEK
jgi:hypothetical protein